MIETVVIVGVGIVPVVASAVGIIIGLWTSLRKSDRHCRQLEAVLDEYRRADAERLDGGTDTEGEA